MESLAPAQLPFACYWFEDKFLDALDGTHIYDIMNTLDRFFSEAQYYRKELRPFAQEQLIGALRERLEYLTEYLQETKKC
jgi:hypothetical protein